jgi:hypothetical protein
VSNRDSASFPPTTSIEISNFKWQHEMEVQFDILVETICPYVRDLDLNANMARLLRRNRGVGGTLSHSLDNTLSV